MAALLHDRGGDAGPYAVAAVFQVITFALYAKVFVPIGGAGLLAGVLLGVLWGASIGFLVDRLSRQEAWRTRFANVPLFLAIVATGLMIGGGLMYSAMMNRVLDEPSTTYAALSALMQPAVPFFIILNSAMELVLVALLIFGNWRTDPARQTLVLVAVTSYLAMRVWTYLVFAEARLDLSQHPLSAADVAWFRSTLATDFRIVLNATTYVCLLVAAFLPAHARVTSLAAPSVERGLLPRPAALR